MALKEDAIPVNNVGGGAIEGTGVGPRGEPGVYRKKRKLSNPLMSKVIKRNIKRFREFNDGGARRS